MINDVYRTAIISIRFAPGNSRRDTASIGLSSLGMGCTEIDLNTFLLRVTPDWTQPRSDYPRSVWDVLELI